MKFKLIIDESKDEEMILFSHSANDFTAKIENLVLSYNGNDEIIVASDDELLNVKFPDIECITVIDRKTFIIDKHGKQYRITQKLFEIEAILPEYFIRINKSSIANERRITRFKASYSGAVDAVFKCGYKEYVSRRCFSNIKRRYGV